jgi:4-aminobutyrate aminotransferase-like enzyme
VAERLEHQGFTHLSSHQNDPLAAATVSAVIDIVEEEGLIERSARVGAYFIERLRELRARHALVADVRGRGLMIGMELAADRGDDLALRFALLCERRGVHVTYSYYEPVIRFIPPLVLAEAQVDEAITVMDEVLATLQAKSPNLQDLLPRNPRSGPFVARSVQGRTPGKIIRGLWNNSPRDWLAKFSGR